MDPMPLGACIAELIDTWPICPACGTQLGEWHYVDARGDCHVQLPPNGQPLPEEEDLAEASGP